jgi:hypothetical protein
MTTALLRLLALPILLATLPAAAQPSGLPEALRGAWTAGDCAAPKSVLAVSARSAVRIDPEGPTRLWRFATIAPLAAWTLGTATGPEAPRLLLRGTAEAMETAEPDPKLRDAALPGTPAIQAWRRCATLPLTFVMNHAEGVAMLPALEVIEAGCTGAPRACAEAIVAAGDVSGDGKLTAAEIGRLTRGFAWLAAAFEGGTAEALGGAGGAGTVAGLLFGRLTIEAMDYDGDGRISAEELAADVGAFASRPGSAAGQPFRLDGVMEGAGMVRGLLEGLLNR